MGCDKKYVGSCSTTIKARFGTHKSSIKMILKHFSDPDKYNIKPVCGLVHHMVSCIKPNNNSSINEKLEYICNHIQWNILSSLNPKMVENSGKKQSEYMIMIMEKYFQAQLETINFGLNDEKDFNTCGVKRRGQLL